MAWLLVQSLLKMSVLFAFMTFIAVTGAVSDSRRVEVQAEENGYLVVKTPKIRNVSRVTVQRVYKNGTKQILFRYCSPEEEKRMCIAVQPERISLQHGNVSVTLPNARATDAGEYAVEVIGDNVKSEKFTLVVTDSGRQSTMPIPVGKIVGITVVLIALGIIFIVIAVCIKKNQKKPVDLQNITGGEFTGCIMNKYQVFLEII